MEIESTSKQPGGFELDYLFEFSPDNREAQYRPEQVLRAKMYYPQMSLFSSGNFPPCATHTQPFRPFPPHLSTPLAGENCSRKPQQFLCLAAGHVATQEAGRAGGEGGYRAARRQQEAGGALI
jgi:hypothetical protein